MQVFKFRSNDNLHVALDIIVESRLFCARISELNDILEGDQRTDYTGSNASRLFQYSQDVESRKQSFRICSLSKTIDSHLMWSHYAGGYKGMAIELEVPDEDVEPIVYDDTPLQLSELYDRHTPEVAARKTLCRKRREWQYEDEVRIICGDKYYGVRSISRIILGSRADESLVKVMRIVCEHYGIELCRMVIAESGIGTRRMP